MINVSQRCLIDKRQFLHDTYSNLIFYAGCPTCARIMTWVKVSGGPNRTTHCWRCPSHKGRKMWPRSGSIFEDSKLPFRKLVAILYCWANDIPNTTAVRMVGQNKECILEWYKVRYCWSWAFSNLNQICFKSVSNLKCWYSNHAHVYILFWS